MKFHSLLVTLAAALLFAGCATMQGSPDYVEYREELAEMSDAEYRKMAGRDLMADFGDIFRWHLAAGEGIGLHVQPTELLQVGALFADTKRVGWQNRNLGVWSERRKEGGVSWSYYRNFAMTPIYGQPGLFDEEVQHRGFDDFTLRHNDEGHWADFGLSGHLVFFGGGFYVSPKEIVDFGFALVNYPLALMRPRLRERGLEPPELDFSDDDTPARIRRAQGQEWVPQQAGFEPAERLDEWMRLPY